MKPINTTFVVVNFLYLVIVLFIVMESLRMGGDGSVVPLVIGVPTAAMALAGIAGCFFPALQPRFAPHESSPESGSGEAAPWSRAGIIVAWLAGFFLLILLIGFYLAIPLYTLAFLKVHGKVAWWKATVTTAVLWAVIYVSFDVLMGQRLFEGILFGALLPVI